MKISISIPWDQYGLISELAEGANQRGINLGKTALQKHVYFLQTLHGVNCGYDFKLYTYGPFSAELLADLDGVAGLGGVEILYYGDSYGYSIKPGPKSGAIRQNASKFLSDASGAIGAVLDEFGRLSAKDLELCATIVYAEREAHEASGGRPQASTIVEIVCQLKPHFSVDQIRSAVDTLADRGYVTVARSRASALRTEVQSARP